MTSQTLSNLKKTIMKNNRDNEFYRLSIFAFSFIFFMSNIIPVIGPSLASYSFGRGGKKFRQRYDISKIAIIRTMIAGHIMFFTISGIILNFIIDFHDQTNLWFLIITGFLLNTLCSIFFYTFGKNCFIYHQIVNFTSCLKNKSAQN